MASCFLQKYDKSFEALSPIVICNFTLYSFVPGSFATGRLASSLLSSCHDEVKEILLQITVKQWMIAKDCYKFCFLKI